ncbi:MULTISPECIES: SMI1/KNR4 family protein [Pseudomonas chlororaphis group]|uniref:SMI1/KNR4 family protein n=1 Tax=Pseudomonas chlororaphis group TaxID=136842 RepID=UPI002097C1D2|nr:MULTISPECIES: SMI1/KNR4 family protein [Pseudomonas chlororaphis group]MCO7580038.1 SMI1/KNR4 family protein [Pseudomonas protegens]MCO7586173.1 SMI1/KNR4 family protein [Pseudomonas chlororaphis]MCO7603251.1 SMI1/KNR4 family protein [Pseudomonas chlororaphis]
MPLDWNTWEIEPGSAVDEQLIAQVQQRLGVEFPALYLELVQYAAAATPGIGTFPYGNGYACISEFFEFGLDNQPWSLLWYASPGRVPGLAAGCLPIARDAGGLLICLDFNSPRVAVEVFDPESASRYPVAADFKAFVELWQP